MRKIKLLISAILIAMLSEIAFSAPPLPQVPIPVGLTSAASIAITGGTIAGTTVTISDYQFLPIESAMDGGTAPAATVELSSTNKIRGRKFSGSANNDVFFYWQPQADSTGTTLTYRVVYVISESTVPANTETVKFALQGVAITGSVGAVPNLLSVAMGTAVTLTDTYATAYLPAQYGLVKTSWSTAVTPANTLAAGKTVLLNFKRDTSDTYAQLVTVVGIEICFQRILAP